MTISARTFSRRHGAPKLVPFFIVSAKAASTCSVKVKSKKILVELITNGNSKILFVGTLILFGVSKIRIHHQIDLIGLARKNMQFEPPNHFSFIFPFFFPLVEKSYYLWNQISDEGISYYAIQWITPLFDIVLNGCNKWEFWQLTILLKSVCNLSKDKYKLPSKKAPTSMEEMDKTVQREKNTAKEV